DERGRGRADRLTQRRYNGADTRGVTVAGAEREVALEVGGRAVAVAGCDACDRAIVPGSAPFRRDPDRGAERELGVAQTSLIRTRESGYERADCRRRDRSAVRLCELREMLGDGLTVVGTRQQDVAAILEDRGVTVSDRLQCTRTPICNRCRRRIECRCARQQLQCDRAVAENRRFGRIRCELLGVNRGGIRNDDRLYAWRCSGVGVQRGIHRTPFPADGWELAPERESLCADR